MHTIRNTYNTIEWYYRHLLFNTRLRIHQMAPLRNSLQLTGLYNMAAITLSVKVGVNYCSTVMLATVIFVRISE